MVNYPVELLTKAWGKLILVWMLHLEPGYLPGRDALVRSCVSWITLHTDGKNTLKNGVLDLLTHWAAVPCVTELTANPLISQLKGSSCRAESWSTLCNWRELVTCGKDNSELFSLML